MLPDFEMIQHSFLGGHDIRIVPLADWHIGSQECREEDLMAFLAKVAETPNVYLMLGGDLLDNGIKSSVTNVYRSKLFPAEQKKLAAKLLEPVRDRILAICPGNHELRSVKEVDNDAIYDIACKLDLEHLYRENIVFMKIQMGKEGGSEAVMGKLRPTYTLVMVHGAGGGVLTGGAVNRNERFGYAIEGMDVLVVGHTHKPWTTQPGKIVIDKNNNKVSIKPFDVISMTSWLGWGGYAARKMLPPNATCAQILTLCGSHKEVIVTKRREFS